MFGIGLIGCGAIAQRRHIPEYANRTDCKLVGFFDPCMERAEQMAAEYGGKAFATLEDLLTCSEIHGVSVCTSNATHAAISIAASQAGKHVLCEKPMATKSEDAKNMIEAAKENEKLLTVAQNQRLDPAHAMAKKLISSGEMGKVLSFQSAFCHGGPEGWLKQSDLKKVWFFQSNASSFGVLGDLGVHTIDLMCWLLGEWAEEISSFVATLDKKNELGQPIDVEDNATILLRFPSGAIGTILSSWTAYGVEDNSAVIHCQNGVIKLHRDGAECAVYGRDGTVKIYDDELPITSGNSGMIDLFIKSLEENASQIPGEDGLRSLQLIEQCL